MRVSCSKGWLLVVALICGSSVYGQVAITGKIAGFVSDSSGAGVAGATVNVTSGALMAPRSAKTGADGSFLFDQLQVGSYQVKFESRADAIRGPLWR